MGQWAISWRTGATIPSDYRDDRLVAAACFHQQHLPVDLKMSRTCSAARKKYISMIADTLFMIAHGGEKINDRIRT